MYMYIQLYLHRLYIHVHPCTYYTYIGITVYTCTCMYIATQCSIIIHLSFNIAVYTVCIYIVYTTYCTSHFSTASLNP